jgi:hypothetical protein
MDDRIDKTVLNQRLKSCWDLHGHPSTLFRRTMTAGVDFFGMGVQGLLKNVLSPRRKPGSRILKSTKSLIRWIPAYAGMTDSEFFMLFNKSLCGSAKSTASCSLIHRFLFHSNLAFLNRII